MRSIFIIILLVCAVPFMAYQALILYVQHYAQTSPNNDLKKLECSYDLLPMDDDDLLAYINASTTTPAENWHEFFTLDKRSCILEEAEKRDLLNEDDLFRYNLLHAWHAGLFGHHAKEAYFYHKIIRKMPNNPLTDPIIKPRLARLYVKKWRPVKDKEYGFHLMHEAVISSTMVTVFLNVGLEHKMLEECEEQASFYNLYKTHIFFWDTPSLIIDARQWLRGLCAMNVDELEDLAERYAKGDGVPKSVYLARKLSYKYR